MEENFRKVAPVETRETKLLAENLRRSYYRVNEIKLKIASREKGTY